MKKANLSGANLDGADLTLADFRGAILKNASLKKAHGAHVALENCDLRGANLALLMLDVSGFDGADFRGSNLKMVRWFPNRLVRANLSGLDLSGVDFSDADCRKINFSKCNLTAADLRGADMCGANLIGACLDYAQLDASHFMRTPGHDKREMIVEDEDGDRPSNTRLTKARLRGSSFRGAILTGAQLANANCRGLDFTGAILRKSDLTRTSFVNARMGGVDLRQANLRECDLTGADLEKADLRQALLINSKLKNAKISGAKVYGVSAWDLDLELTEQVDLVITRNGAQEITVDNLEIAQFLHLILANTRIRRVVDSIATKVVLILGRFTKERKTVLEAIRARCRDSDLVPILFDFEKPSSRDLTETVTTLARLARFVVADITDAKSIPQELQAIVPDLPSVPVQPLVLKGANTYAMFEHFSRYRWVLPIFEYRDQYDVAKRFQSRILTPVQDHLRLARKGS